MHRRVCVGAWGNGQRGEFGEGQVGFELGSFWVRFPEPEGVVYFHNPLSDRSLRSFLAFREIGFVLGSFFVVRGGTQFS